MPRNVVEWPVLRDKTGVFRDRHHGGLVLATLLQAYRGTDAVVLGVPAGGMPVAAVLSAELSLPLGVAVVSKITLPWNPEAGYGAVAFDGTVRLNQSLVSYLGLSPQEMERGTTITYEKVQRRVQRFGMDWRSVIPGVAIALLVDDGLASGFTLRVAAEALGNNGVERIIIAVPTGHCDAVRSIAGEVGLVYCANIRGGRSFAVADAYETWSDVSEDDALRTYGQVSMHLSVVKEVTPD